MAGVSAEVFGVFCKTSGCHRTLLLTLHRVAVASEQNVETATSPSKNLRKFLLRTCDRHYEDRNRCLPLPT